MSDKQTDRLGRATFHHIAPARDVHPTTRERRWFRHIARHGPQSSAYLHELTRDTHRCRDTSLRRLQALRAGGFLSLPVQQRSTAHAAFNPYIYDLTQRSEAHLRAVGAFAPDVRPRGHWWHSYLTACVTSSIDILATRSGNTFLPAREILALKNATLAIPHGTSTLIPDQLFAIDYGGIFRAFALELDRGTEPITSPANRKSWARSIAQYDDVLARGLAQSHYGLTASLIVLWVFTSKEKERSFQKLLLGRPGLANRAIFTQTLSRVSGETGPVPLQRALYGAPWVRADGPPLVMSEV